MLLGLFSIKITQVSCSIYVKRRRSSSKLCNSERKRKQNYSFKIEVESVCLPGCSELFPSQATF